MINMGQDTKIFLSFIITFIVSGIMFVSINSFTDVEIDYTENKVKYSYKVCENFGGPLSFDCDSVTCNDGKIVTVNFKSLGEK